MYPPTPRSTVTRHAERASYDREVVHGILDEAIVCHVGFVAPGGHPVVLPNLHVRLGEQLYLHGSTGARLAGEARSDGVDLCVTVTLLDGLVLARTAMTHSANYRSVVVHGTGVLVTDREEKTRVLAALVDHLVPGRSERCRPPNQKELAATAVIRVDLSEVSAKVRSGPPRDDPADLDLPYWAGVVPLALHAGEPVPAGELPAGAEPRVPPGPFAGH